MLIEHLLAIVVLLLPLMTLAENTRSSSQQFEYNSSASVYMRPSSSDDFSHSSSALLSQEYISAIMVTNTCNESLTCSCNSTSAGSMGGNNDLMIEWDTALYTMGCLILLLSGAVVVLSVILICGKLKYSRKMDAMKRSMQTSESFSLDAKYVFEDNKDSSLQSQIPSKESILMSQTTITDVEHQSEETTRMVKNEPRYEELSPLDKSDAPKRYDDSDPVSPNSDTARQDCETAHTEVPKLKPKTAEYSTPVDSLQKELRLSKRRKGSVKVMVPNYESIMEKSLRIMKKNSTEVLGDDELEMGVIVAEKSKPRPRLDYDDVIPVTRTRSEVSKIKKIADEAATSPQSGSHPGIYSILNRNRGMSTTNADTPLDGDEGVTYSKLTGTPARFHQMNQSCPDKTMPVYATIENKEET